MALSIDIGTRNFHIVAGHVTGNQVHVDKAFLDTIPGGMVQDGVIREFAGLETAFKNTFGKFKIRDRNCIITINGNHIYTRELDVPKAKPQIMANVVTFEVQNAMSGNRDVTVEYVASKQQNLEKPSLLHVRASAIQTEYILDYAKMLKSLKLKPVAFDIHPNAITKLISQRTINDMAVEDANIMVIDIGCVTSTAYVITSGDIAYSRIIPIGSIDIERYCSNVNNNAKQDEMISLDQIDLSLNSLRANQALGDAVRPLVSALTDGVNRIQQFLSGRMMGNKLNTIYIYGRGSTYKGLEETLTESMGQKVECIRRLSGVHFPAGQEMAPFINAIGALIRVKG